MINIHLHEKYEELDKESSHVFSLYYLGQE